MNIASPRGWNPRRSCLSRPKAGPRKRPGARRLHFEPLEARQLLDGMGWESNPFPPGVGDGSSVVDMIVESGSVYTLCKKYVENETPRVLISEFDAGTGQSMGDDIIVATDSDGTEYLPTSFNRRGTKCAVVGKLIQPGSQDEGWLAVIEIGPGGSTVIHEQIDPDVVQFDNVTFGGDGTVCASGPACDEFGDRTKLVMKKCVPETQRELWKTTLAVSGGYVSAARRVLEDKLGRIYIAATVEFGDFTDISGVTKLAYGKGTALANGSAILIASVSADGAEVTGALIDGDSSDSVSEICLDDDGNVLFVGSTDSWDYPLVGPSPGVPVQGSSQAVVGMLSADLSELEWSAKIGDAQGRRVEGRLISAVKEELLGTKGFARFIDVCAWRQGSGGNKPLDYLDYYRFDENYELTADVKKVVSERGMPSGRGTGFVSPFGTQLYLFGGSGPTSYLAMTVLNHAPVITSLSNSSPACGGATEGQEVTVSATFTDADPEDTHTATIDWGDGTVTDAAVVEGARLGVHVYKDGGIRPILVVLDDGWDVVGDTTTAMVTGAGVSDGVLQVVGTAGNDEVLVWRLCGQILVTADFLPGPWHTKAFDAAGIERIDVVLGGGNDVAVVAWNVGRPAKLDGGPGDDRLKGSWSDDILLGGPGNDLLVGSAGRDLVIGGTGLDLIVGDAGDDILIAGTTLWDANDTALMAIMAEWTSGRSFATRVKNIRGIDNPEFGDRLNRNSAEGIDYFLSPDGAGKAATPTVFDDSERDTLTGGLGQDWFLANIVGGEEDSGVRDWITDLSRADFGDDLKFILSAGEG
jgi:Ca2+-binding RTX toxin-like protein